MNPEMVMRLDKDFLWSVLPDAVVAHGQFPEDFLFCVDTRSLQKGDIFIALKGKQTDGHLFVKDALQKHAGGIFIEKSKQDLLKDLDQDLLKKKLVVLVDNALSALTLLATAWRQRFDYPVVGITGSVGKTSTKEVLARIVAESGKNYLVSRGNQNSVIGLSLNVLRMRPTHEGAIFELGINKRGEMETLVDIAKPTIGLITGVGHTHMAGLGAVADIAAEKRIIFKYFKEENIGVINGDQPMLSSIGYAHPVIRFGCKTTNQIQARKVRINESSIDFVLKIYHKKYSIRMQGTHIGVVFNAIAAACVARLLGIHDDVILKGIQQQIVVPGRFECKKLTTGKGSLIDDCYNASPESVKAALLAFEKIETQAKKILVFGDMLELGVDSAFWHRQIGRFLRKAPSVHTVILVGSLVKWVSKTLPVGIKVELVATWQEAVELLKKLVAQESLLLVKGSTAGYTNGLVHLVRHFTANPQNGQDIQLIAATAMKDDILHTKKKERTLS